ncbi:hypothetical protein CWATWH0005_5338 [Crocosphaera watsonii WH 0005]|uniref:Uncharacterized protein n=1 Tax=Crocosphaera watsonii WH 0005 TaxID=423472 RepID=T2ISF0_CROWT|nr:hypothetical protein CWATWH0005_5338 [Crocosphaera watsonii WH 0005]
MICLEDNPVNCEANSRGFEIVAVEITQLIFSTELFEFCAANLNLLNRLAK